MLETGVHLLIPPETYTVFCDPPFQHLYFTVLPRFISQSFEGLIPSAALTATRHNGARRTSQYDVRVAIDYIGRDWKRITCCNTLHYPTGLKSRKSHDESTHPSSHTSYAALRTPEIVE